MNKNYTELHDQRNIKFCVAKQAKQIYKYKNIKTKLYKNNADIWYNKTCRMKRITSGYISIKVNGNNPQRSSFLTAIPGIPIQSDIYQYILYYTIDTIRFSR